MSLAIDCSNYSGPLTAKQVADLKAAGVTRVIVQAIDPPSSFPIGQTRQQIMALQAGGLDVEAYVYLWFNEGLAPLLRRLILLDRLGITRVWLDVEDGTPTSNPRAVMVAQALDAIRAQGFTTGIYSAAWFWGSAMASDKSFVNLDWWVAQYDGDASMNVAAFPGCGRVVMKQYAGTSQVAGIPQVDLDFYEEDDMPQFTDAQVAAILGVVQWREAVVPLIDSLVNKDTLTDVELADIKAKLAAISTAAGG